MADMKTYGLPRLALLIVILSCLFYTSNSVALAQEATPTFTPPPVATIKATSTEPGAPTSTSTPVPPTATFTRTPTPIAPTSTYTPPPTLTPMQTPTDLATDAPTATPTNVPTEVAPKLTLNIQGTVTEGDRFWLTLTLNRPLSCDLNVEVWGDVSIMPSALIVTIPAGETILDFWMVALNNDEIDTLRVVSITLNGFTGCPEFPIESGILDDITIYDPPTNIEEGIEPGRNNNYLPLIAMGISLGGSGFVVGFILIVSLAVLYTRRRK